MNKQGIYAGQPRGKTRIFKTDGDWCAVLTHPTDQEMDWVVYRPTHADACRAASSVWTTWKREAVEYEALNQLLAAHGVR